jgi:hypothetical protein
VGDLAYPLFESNGIQVGVSRCHGQIATQHRLYTNAGRASPPRQGLSAYGRVHPVTFSRQFRPVPVKPAVGELR